MARRGAPALYELLSRGRESRGGTTGGTTVPNSAPGRRPGPTSIGPISPASSSGASSTAGRSGPPIDPALVRVLGMAVIGIALLVGVYSLGVARGRAAGALPTDASGAQASVEPSRAGQSPATEVPPPAAPIAREEPRSGNARPASGERGADRAAERSGDGQIAGAVGAALPPAQRGIDPRQAGLQYIVIASVLESNADKLVQFCRDRGLDAWVVPDQNGRLREITVLPGFPKSELKGPVASELKSRIRKVGAQWKAAGRGNSDFEDHYFKPFNG